MTQPGLEGTKGWQGSGRRLGEELRRGCSEARRHNFQIRNQSCQPGFAEFYNAQRRP